MRTRTMSPFLHASNNSRSLDEELLESALVELPLPFEDDTAKVAAGAMGLQPPDEGGNISEGVLVQLPPSNTSELPAREAKEAS